MKICPKCKKGKDLSEYHKSSNRGDGVVVYCKECTSKIAQERYSKTLSKKTCSICQKTFLGKENAVNCSRKCSKRILKGIDGHKDCPICGFHFPYRNSLKKRGVGNIRGGGIASIKTIYCSQKCSRLMLGDISRSEKVRKINKEKMKGNKYGKRKLRLEERVLRRNRMIGSKSHFWKGGITNKNTLIRQSLEYKLWRESVFKRDDYTCQWCLERGGELQADHIKPFALYPELRFDINNGRTLCVQCHKKTDTYAGRCIKR